MKLVNMHDSKSCAFGFVGSSPTSSTMLNTSDKEALAYIIGVAIGDGNLSNPNGRAVRLRITCDKKYPKIIEEIIKNLEIIAPRNKISKINRKEKCIDISCYSNDWEKILGWKAKEGSKMKQKIRIPAWIKENKKYINKLLKGLFQTDGSIYYDRKYKMVNFTSSIPGLSEEIIFLIKEINFEAKIYYLSNKTIIRLNRKVDDFIKTIDLIK